MIWVAKGLINHHQPPFFLCPFHNSTSPGGLIPLPTSNPRASLYLSQFLAPSPALSPQQVGFFQFLLLNLAVNGATAIFCSNFVIFFPKKFRTVIMDIISSPVTAKDREEKPNFLVEITNTEKQLLSLIHAKGLLRSDVQDLYCKICSSYERVILNDYGLVELQDIEFSLWKLHYRHINEFRKRIKKTSIDSDSAMHTMSQSDDHVEGFKSFLLKAAEFYKTLITKIRSHYGLPEESLMNGRSGISTEPKKLQKWQFLCHRFLVCLGDLARYRELCGKSVKSSNWSAAASYYLEATMIWPDGGNPQNQLAVLATYVGDDFLALYHCIRSLAVKDPFPDAWNNLILLFDRNRSCSLPSLSSEDQFDFLKPSERSYGRTTAIPEHDSSNMWSLIIRTLSFFFIKSSLEHFPSSFASTMKELDSVLTLYDTKLKAMSESYQLLDSSRTGPFRFLQVVAVLIFIFHNIINSREKEGREHPDLMQMALTATFIFMGRLVERCFKTNSVLSCPILPAVLVFVEWLTTVLDEAEAFGLDEKTRSAMSYFFAAFVDLLRLLKVKSSISSSEKTALWEDYELRGFAPLTQIHGLLDFSWEHTNDFESGIGIRASRTIDAAMKIAKRANGSFKWIVYDSSAKTFYTTEENVISGRKETEKLESRKVHGKSVVVEEEEVILFKPLTRYNSAPLYTNGRDPGSPKGMEDQTVAADECLRRATSVLIAQSQAQGHPSDFHSDLSNFRHGKGFKQQEPPTQTSQPPFSEGTISAGPPSLNAWVLDKEKIRSGFRQELRPIEESVSESLNGISISETQESVTCSKSEATTNNYAPPLPSAPLLPEDAAWFSGGVSNRKSVRFIEKPELFYDTPQTSSYSDWPADSQLHYTPPMPGFTGKVPPFRGLSSSEWLRQYRQSRGIDPASGHTWPVNYYAPGSPRDFSGSPLFDQYGIPSVPNTMMYNEAPQLPPGFFHGYQRPMPYGCGAVNELRDDPRPLLQYLKEKEWLLQQDQTLNNHRYMGN